MRSRGRNRHANVNQEVKTHASVNPRECLPHQRQFRGTPPHQRQSRGTRATPTTIPKNNPRSWVDGLACGPNVHDAAEQEERISICDVRGSGSPERMLAPNLPAGDSVPSSRCPNGLFHGLVALDTACLGRNCISWVTLGRIRASCDGFWLDSHFVRAPR